MHLPVLEAVKSQKWRAGSPTVVTYNDRTVIILQCRGGGGGEGAEYPLSCVM